jgi:hypothetical protein
MVQYQMHGKDSPDNSPPPKRRRLGPESSLLPPNKDDKQNSHLESALMEVDTASSTHTHIDGESCNCKATEAQLAKESEYAESVKKKYIQLKAVHPLSVTQSGDKDDAAKSVREMFEKAQKNFTEEQMQVFFQTLENAYGDSLL